MAQPTADLSTIRTKVRRLTRTPSQAQLSDADLDNYINTFVVYDFPEHLRTFNLRTTFSFYTNPYQDEYPTDTASFVGATTNPLYDFQNLYLTIHSPIYIAGYPSLFSQSRDQFYAIYPLVNSIASIGVTGDGVTTTFSGVINSAQSIIPSTNFAQKIGLLQNNVLFSGISTNNSGLSLVDVPVKNTATGDNLSIGNLYIPGQEPTTPPIAVLANNFINYATGAFTITFPTAPAAGSTINSQTVPQNLALPQALLYYNNTFFVRPVPDQPYTINFEAYISPVSLLQTNSEPKLREYWQMIALGASIKIFQDRMDMDSVALIQPEFNLQMRLALRRNLVQYSNERTASIYTEQTNYGAGAGFGWGGSGPF